MTSDDRLTHQDNEGRPRMVDVSDKAETSRSAIAEGHITMRPETVDAIRQGTTKKGDPLQVAQIAGIMAGKRTGELIPLCHVLPATSVGVELVLDPELPGVRASAGARVAGSTGVEMEALMAVSVALLTVYDMVKALDRGMVIEGIRLVRKEGGRSGVWAVSDRKG